MVDALGSALQYVFYFFCFSLILLLLSATTNSDSRNNSLYFFELLKALVGALLAIDVDVGNDAGADDGCDAAALLTVHGDRTVS